MSVTFSRTMRSLELDSFRGALIAWLIGGLLLAAWLIWFVVAKVTVYEISSKARLEVNSNSNPITALVSSKIVFTSLTLGQEVKIGDVLITLDAGSDVLHLEEEKSRLDAIPPQIAALEKQIMSLEHAKTGARQANIAAIQGARSRQAEAGSALVFAKDNERRLTELSNLGQMPLMETLKARSEAQKLNAAKDALTSDIQRLQKEAETQVYQHEAEIEHLNREVARLKGEWAVTQTAMARLQHAIDNHLVRAPISGQIGDSAPMQAGSYVTAGEKLGTVVPHSELRIVADFPPASVIGRIHPGQAATMRLDGFPWAQYGVLRAKVSRVGSEIRDNQVRVEFIPENAINSLIVLQHGLPGTIEVSIERLSPAVMVLRAAGQLMAGGVKR